MHIALSWDISATGEKWKEINEKLKQKLKGYSWVKPLKTFYVVKVSSVTDRDKLVDALNEVAKDHNEVNIIATPVMSGGDYNGWLPEDLWDKINARTKQ